MILLLYLKNIKPQGVTIITENMEKKNNSNMFFLND